MKKAVYFLIFALIITMSINTFSQEGSNWKWVHQKPQGNYLRWVKMFDANNWYAVAYYGTFMKTTNAGVNWFVYHNCGGYTTNGVGRVLYSGWFFNQNTGLVCGASGWIARTTNGGLNWDSIGTGTTSTLYGLHFVDNSTGYCAGTSGVIIKTTNGGLNWTTLTTGVTSSIYNIYALGNNVYGPTSSGNILISTNGGANFTSYYTGTSFTVYDALFINSNTGFVCGSSGNIRGTTDGGQNWIGYTSGTTSLLYELYSDTASNPGGNAYFEGFENTNFPPTGWHIKNLGGPTYTWVRSTSQYYQGVASAFINYEYPGPSNDWLVTPQWSIQAGDSLVFYWKNAFSTPYPPDSLYIKISTTDTAVGSFTNTLAAINTAVAPFTWTRNAYSLNAFAGQNIYIAFQHVDIDGNGGYLDNVTIVRQPSTSYTIYSVGDASNLVRTTNLGANWSLVNFIAPGQYIATTMYTVAALQNNILVAGAYGLMNKSTNSGSNWTTLSTAFGVSLIYSIWVEYNEGRVWAPGVNVGQVLYSSNGGNTWAIQNTGSSSTTFYDIFMLNANTGYICGNYGVVRKTTNGGANWDSVPSPMPWSSSNVLRKMYWFDANNGIVTQTASSTGGYFITSNGGNTWNTAYTGIDDRIYALSIIDQNTAYAANYTPQVMKTTNGGNNWTLLSAPMGSGFIYSMRFFNANTGYVSATSGARLVKTTNGGNTFDTVYMPVTTGIYAMAWLNFNIGYVFTTSGGALRTTNAGQSWTLENVGTSFTPYAAFIRASDSVFLAGSSGIIFKRALQGIPTGLEWTHQIPTNYELKQNYPNPFNPTTTIEFALPKTGNVTLKVFDIAGREVDILINNQELTAGTVKYVYNASKLASGVYFYSLIVNGNVIDTKKMLLIK
ncbi:MAG: choice-of-anchor J domain-containing protein [Ignavibacteria bacterium]|nr:choice-of-anchor J domain-containing protein [Ignavibacteria bacterium]